MSMDKQSARDSLEKSEDRFTELTQGAKDLVDQEGTRYAFVDGSEATGIEAAARQAERIVRATERAANG